MPDAKLAEIYAELAAQAQGGPTAAAVARETSTLQRSPGGAIALPFTQPFGSIRLMVAPVNLDAEAQAAVDEAVACAAAGWPKDAVFLTPRAQLHVTLFHVGRPGDTRPVLDDAGMADELGRVRAVAAKTPAFSLVVDRLLLSDSGVLLLLFQTAGGDRTPFAMREAFRAAFPDAPAKQSILLHSSLARFLEVPPSQEALAAATAACERATQLLHGREVPMRTVWHVVESALPVAGTTTDIPLLG
jgi:hypothetical protein